jgi:fatty-acyl-CoA synthase
MPGVQVVIRSDDFKPLPQGEMGLITVLTPVRFDGYWLDPEKTSETLRGGWVVMGDLGYFDTAGYLHVLGRSADRVSRNGQLLNPREVEEVAHTHPSVKEACLVQHGAQAVLVLSLRQSWRKEHDWRTLEGEIAQYLVQQLPAHLQPDDVRIVEEIPRSFLNKMLRREVRLMLEAAPQRAAAPAPTSAAVPASVSAVAP